MSATSTVSTSGAAILPASSTTLTTTASTAGTCSQLGYSYSSLTYGTGFKAAALLAVPVLFAGAAMAGAALLSYAVTKAALEP